MEQEIAVVRQSEYDSAKTFNLFNSKNLSYYRSANDHLNGITDSVLKQKISALINTHMENYKTEISQYEAILETIKKNNNTLNDLHIILKITKTLPIIKQYQKEQKPAIKPLQEHNSRLEKLIRQTESLQ